MAPRTRYARNGDVHIAYQVIGDGPFDLLWIPQSFSQVEHLWESPAVARFFERLASFSRLIVFDRRESGMSDRTGRVPTLEEQMDDVIAVLDAVGAERVGVFSMLEGGPMAMVFAASHPERVQSLALYATFARTTAAEGYEFAPPAEERRIRLDLLNRFWGDGAMLNTFGPSAAGDRSLREWIGKLQRLSMGPTAATQLSGMNERTDVRPILGSIRVPTLVLHRTDDQAIDFRHSRYLAEHIPEARLVELPGRDNFIFLGDTESIVGEIEEFFTGHRQTVEPDRVLATVLFTDIVASTERAASLGDARWREVLADLDSASRRAVSSHQGRHIKTTGDGVLATFNGPARAIRGAQAMVEDARELGLELRAGLHTGEVEVIGNDVGGLAVHIGARVMDAAGPGEVLVSSTVRDLVVGSGLSFDDRGARELRGIPGEWRLWAVA